MDLLGAIYKPPYLASESVVHILHWVLQFRNPHNTFTIDLQQTYQHWDKYKWQLPENA